MTKENLVQPISVSQCVELVRTTLQAVVGELTVYGEVSELQRRSGGSLVFFSLKDESSYLRCFMLEHELKVALADGMEIRVTGYPSLFKKNAGFHMRVQRIELVGEGALRKQLELTKKKLEHEGLFSVDRKRALPAFPEHIGIITSEDAAAFTDVKRVLSNRWPITALTLVPSQVQGGSAIKQLLRALDFMANEVAPDVIILTRGGGSLEDLQAFNSEELARKIFALHVPVVVGVGHERDWTIADFVADVRAATPSNAAELCTPRTQDVLLHIDSMIETLGYSLRKTLDQRAHGLFRAVARLSGAMSSTLEHVNRMIAQVQFFGVHIYETVIAIGERVDFLARASYFGIKSMHDNTSERFGSLQKLLQSVSPRAVLKRGYSITRVKGKVVTSSRDVVKSDILITTLSDGEIKSEVT